MLASKVFAQSEPTFPYDGPFEDPVTTPDEGEAVLNLSTDISSLEIDETADIDLTLESGETEIVEYDIAITFNPTVLQVLDNDTLESGVQIDFQDAFADVEINNVNNEEGTINLRAVMSGGAETVNRKIATIKVRAVETGASVISVSRLDSSVLDSSETNILATTNSLNFSISGETEEVEEDLPDTGIWNTGATIGTIHGAIVMIFSGIKTIRDNKRKKHPLDY